MKSLQLLAIACFICSAALSQTYLNFGAGPNIMFSKGYKLCWNVGVRSYTQLTPHSFISGTIDYNHFAVKAISRKTSYTTLRAGYEVFATGQRFHAGIDAGYAIQGGDATIKENSLVVSIGPGLLLKSKQGNGHVDLGMRYTYEGRGFDWLALRVAYGFSIAKSK